MKRLQQHISPLPSQTTEADCVSRSGPQSSSGWWARSRSASDKVHDNWGMGLKQTWQVCSRLTLSKICFYRLLLISPTCLQKRDYILSNHDGRSQTSTHFYTVVKVTSMYKWLLIYIKLQVYGSQSVCNSKVALGHLSVLCLYLRFFIKTVLTTQSFNRI